VDLANKRKGISFEKALAQEIRDAATGQGNAVKKRDETHRMAQANRAFAHLRW
jgi:small subunit ribosomal protein S7